MSQLPSAKPHAGGHIENAFNAHAQEQIAEMRKHQTLTILEKYSDHTMYSYLREAFYAGARWKSSQKTPEHEWHQYEPLLSKVTASTIEKLVSHHKRTCEGESCTISLGLLIPVYEQLLGREITQDELRQFL